MAKYKIEVKKSVAKELQKIPSKSLQKILAKIASLADNPHSSGSVKLSSQNKYRLRFGDYRILYKVEDEILTIFIVKVGNRKDVYRNL